MTITAVLVDDEPKALAILKNKIERFCSNIVIIGETQDPNEAIALIERKKPQLVFLDIAMPQMSGFDMLTKFSNPQFEVIFVTAFDEYAIDAINYCAIGYLLKPVDNQSLIATVIKAAQNIEDKSALSKNKLLIQNLGVQTFQKKKIVVPTHDGLEFVEISNIIFCEGTEGYTKIHFLNLKTILSSYSIGHFVKLLSNQDFYLIHKSYLINLNHIEKYLNEGYVVLTNNHKLPISRNRRSDFIDNIKN
ncbi:LytR/AlgR family response regulator transcription factor [Polaribacter glomeratus]|uniref:DNA-binding response regulator n=1 Tax=Polaribacter glomeratus TaxID=102 RepID=A0A2S7WI93_9FLAO|nr:response regulator [Polaribacter glomeratus]PQJ77327.1 DNA-binding response regulator [Polaribacter glomeratus]TXD65912.1 response regulator [Polaribacter glomeratus]